MKNIIIIPGLDSKIDIWKTTKTNQKSVYHHLENKHNVVDLIIPLDKYSLNTDELIYFMNDQIPENSYILANSFGCVMGLIYASKYPDKVKGIILLDPTTLMESYRFDRIDNIIIKQNLLKLLELQENIRYLNSFPIISHVILPLKKLMNPEKKVTDLNVFNILNNKFSFLKLLSNNPKSNIIIHPNCSHFIQQVECEKIKCNIDYLISN